MLKDKPISFVALMAQGITLRFTKKLKKYGTIILYGNMNSKVWFRKMRRSKKVLIKRDLL